MRDETPATQGRVIAEDVTPATQGRLIAQDVRELVRGGDHAIALEQIARLEALPAAAARAAGSALLGQTYRSRAAALRALRRHVRQHVAARSGGAFEREFEREYSREARRRGADLVTLAHMRRALPQYDRATFDAGLRELRRSGRFDLDTHEGRHGSISDAERAAGITELGRRYVYVARR